MDDARPLPPPVEVLDRLQRHLHNWLGAWPPDGDVMVVGSEQRCRPGWDGVVRPFAGVAIPGGAVLSVPPDRAPAVRAGGADLDGVLDRLPQALGAPGSVVGRGVFRYAVAPPDLGPAGEWLPADDPRLPSWLRPFGGQVLVILDGGRYAAGVGIKRHDELGHEVAVATDERWRDRGFAKALVARAAARILQDGGVPIYLHHRANTASARVAAAAGFADVGWSVLGLPTAS